ncbi:hypothetical protein B296_00002394 [Ensete ventricosum]|uniref:Uncharacterized protein n=1 Tax=Ensete ventricosum TaxID=4639 RepID=A0A427AFY9_ENSVE|nr:hypothetical protein B296_00002394 [Ensete ventricosum]
MRGFVGTRGCGSQRCCRCGKSRRCPSEVDSLVTTVTGLYRPCTAPNATNSIYSADIPWNNTRHAARIFLLPAPVGSTSRRSLPRIGCAKMHTPLYPKRSETPPRGFGGIVSYVPERLGFRKSMRFLGPARLGLLNMEAYVGFLGKRS